ncbi:MAG: type transporter [Bryobacterales bacterium]|nr:type transporter [Bryobacterales bacterium]
MRSAALLLAYSLKRVRALTITTGLLLAALQLVLIFVAGSIQSSGGFDQLSALLPPFARQLLGPSAATFMSFSGIVCLGYFDLAVMIALIALAVTLATTPASEVEIGFMDLILARPLARHWIITRTIVLTALVSAALLALMVGGTWAGLQMFAPAGVPWPSARLVNSLAINVGMLTLCWGGVAMAIGAASSRRSVAGGATGLLALATYLLDYVARLWQPAEKVAWLSPFRYYNPFDLIIGNPLPIKNLVVLGAIAVAGFAAAYVLFARRDISH